MRTRKERVIYLVSSKEFSLLGLVECRARRKKGGADGERTVGARRDVTTRPGRGGGSTGHGPWEWETGSWCVDVWW